MPPARRTRTSTIVRVRWQRRTAAIPAGTVQAVIQQASDHFHLGHIVDDLVLVAVIQDEALELTSDTLKLLAKDAVIVLRHIIRVEPDDVVENPVNAAPPPSVPRGLDRRPELPAHPLPAKARSPCPIKGSCACGSSACVAGQHRPPSQPASLPRSPQPATGTNVKREVSEEDMMTVHVSLPNTNNHAKCTFGALPSVTCQALLDAVATKLGVSADNFSLFSADGHPISLQNSICENGIRDGATLEFRVGRFGRGGDGQRDAVGASLPKRTTMILDGKYGGLMPP